ncbi:DUF488 family protein [Methylacidimicrobium sp. AP8]|uniref:DUF488 domain-containing protein n=1 Tax=Methylacidimicrobium sp. AP8 TaxID=2730359 RepID=UPI00192109D3|nr:DUF488 domain-containing protein [Methylacidimicrobium sp. AP8]
MNPASPPPASSAVFTLGHGTRSLGEFVLILKAAGIRLVVDIRTIPRSRHNPQFNRERLPAALAAEGIGYEHWAVLGGLRHPKRDSPNGAWRNSSFRAFADYMQTPEFASAVVRLEQTSRRTPLVLLCAETVPWRCHRSLVADALLVRGVPVVHLLDATHRRPHRITPWARVADRRLTYPAAPPPGGEPEGSIGDAG